MPIHCNRRGVHSNTSHVIFSPAQCTCLMMYNHTTWLKTSHWTCLHARVTRSSCHPWWAVERLSLVACFSVPRFVPFRVSLLHLALLFPILPVLWPEPLLPCGQRQGKHTLRFRQLRSLALWQNSLLPQVMSPSSLTTSTTRRLLKWSSTRNLATKTCCPRTCVTWNSTMRPSGKRYFHQCTFRREENQRTEDKLTLSWRKCVASSVIFRTLKNAETVHELCSLSSCRERKPSREKENGKRNTLKDKKSKFSLTSELSFRNTNFKPILKGEVFRNWMESSSLSEEKLIILLHVMNNFDEINFFLNNYHNKIVIFVKLILKVLMRWKNWSDVKGQDSMIFRKEDWLKINTLSMNSRPEFRNYRVKSIVWMTREIFKDAESVRSGLSHVPSQPALLPPFRNTGGML